MPCTTGPTPVPAFIPDGGAPATWGMVGRSGTGGGDQLTQQQHNEILAAVCCGKEEPEATLRLRAGRFEHRYGDRRDRAEQVPRMTSSPASISAIVEGSGIGA